MRKWKRDKYVALAASRGRLPASRIFPGRVLPMGLRSAPLTRDKTAIAGANGRANAAYLRGTATAAFTLMGGWHPGMVLLAW
jgi:hypothetical protein